MAVIFSCNDEYIKLWNT